MMEYQSPVPRFPGYIVLPEFLTMPQVMAFESALGNVSANLPADGSTRVWLTVSDGEMVKAALLTVKEWHIQGMPEDPSADTFPFSPRKASHDLILWIFGLIRDLWVGELADPNP
jgi:hypothetical protein